VNPINQGGEIYNDIFKTYTLEWIADHNAKRTFSTVVGIVGHLATH
jgi:hypothetical protein